MLSNEIRSKFLNYFKNKQHQIIPSSSVVPHDDPTLLFINAGMNQFKDVFLGKAKRDYVRAASSQKCIRVGGKHNDLENVGHTSRHATFFEMIGNFSFGDYFKKEAIRYAWEITTEIFQFPIEKLFVTVYETDDEAFELWKEHIEEKRIVKIATEDNFWSMGKTGPCGPSSELFFDRGSKYGSAASPKEDTTGERYIEFWNLVFMQFDRTLQGDLSPLPKKSIDTGAGLERVVSLMTEVDSIFETDVLRHIISKMEAISGRSYNPKDPLLAPAFHVVSDHLRTLSFAIADGVEPSNIERGYVLRKVLRRAVRYGKMLGMDKPFMGKLLPSLVETMGTAYHELNTAKGRIEEILSLEEEGFLRTLKRGGNMLNSIISSAKQASTHEISGEDAFKLKDTYGFPIEEILLLATDSDLKVDLNAFNSFEAKAKETSRSSKKETVQKVETSLYEEFLQKHDPSEFVGYDSVEDDGSVIGLIVNGVFVQKMSAEEEGIVLLDKTPFYAEKGGQVGDVGALTHKDAKFIVKDCKAPYDGVIAHIGKLEKGTLLIGEPMTGSVDRLRREAICKNHTATHLLHFALQKVLGEHIRQAGSLVEENRIRFDFNHHKPLSEEDVRAIESIINHKIWQGGSVKTEEISYSSIQNHPEIKQFFGDKYGDQVRLVSIDGFSKELCGGTHCNTLGSIGLFRITKEGSIAKGVRRIEAVIGMDAETFMYKSDKRLSQIAETLQVKTSQVEERVVTLSEENRTLKQSVKSMRQATLAALSDSLIKTANCINKINVIQAKVDMDPKELGAFADLLLRKMPSGIVILAAIDGDKCQIHVSVSPDLVKKGVYANALIKHISCAIKGGGGGKKETAQAGGKNPSGIDEALNLATEWIHDHH